MATTESRTLEIQATVRDKITRTMGRIARKMGRIIRTGMLAPFKAMGRVLKGMRSQIVGLAGALGSMFLVWRGGQWANQVLESADALNKLAQSTATAVEQISVLEQAFQFAGLTGEQFRAIITGLGRGVSAAINNAQSLQGQAFSDLDVSLDTLMRGDQVEIFRGIARGLEQFNTQAEKAAVLQRIFPDNFQRLLPLLDDLENGFNANVKAAEAYGAALSQDLADTASKTADNLLKLNIGLTGVARQGILTFSKEMQPALEGLAEFVRLNKDGLSSALVSSIRLLADAMLFLARQILWLAGNLPQFGREVSNMLGDVAGIGGLLQKGFDALRGADGLDGLRMELDKVATTYVRLQEDAKRGDPLEMKAAAERAEKLRVEFQRIQKILAEGDSDVDPEVEVRKAIDRARIRQLLGRLPQSIDRFAANRDLAVAFKRTSAADAEGGTPEAQTARWGQFFDAFGQGMQNAVRRWDDFKAAGQQAGETVVNSVGRGLEDAFTDLIMGTKSAKEAFRDMANAILADIARIIARMQAMRIVRFIFNSWGSGGDAGSLGMQGGGGAAGGITGGGGGGLGANFGGDSTGGGGRPNLRPVVVAQQLAPMEVRIEAMDGASVERVLTNNGELLANLQVAALQSQQPMRQQVRRVARHR